MVSLQERSHRKCIIDLIKEGESREVEFKSSMKWDYKQDKVNEELKKVIAKTISAFLNSSGGTLIIGVNDSGTILGLEKDFSTLKDKNKDGFERELTRVILNYIDIGKVCMEWIRVGFEKISEKLICVVKVSKASKPTYFTNKDRENDLFIRAGNAIQKLDTKEANDYVRVHWKEPPKGDRINVDSLSVRHQEKSSPNDVYPFVRNDYKNEKMKGTVKFDYSNNDGMYQIGKELYRFTIRVSSRDNNSLHLYNYPGDIKGVGLVDGMPRSMPLSDIKEYTLDNVDMSSKARSIDLSNTGVLLNKNDMYALLRLKKATRGAPHYAEIEYFILRE